MSALDKEAITAPNIAHVHPCDGNGLHGGGRCNHDQDESWARTKVMMSFIAGIIWWISVAVAYEPRHLQAELGSMVFTFIACSLIHIIIHRQSTHDGSRIFHPLSCSHFVQATIMYISFMIIYTFSPAAFHKHWIYITLTWVTYISGMMVASKEAWELIDRNQRLFWIIHHNLSFFFLGMVPLISADSWDEVFIKSCYIYLVAQIWNSSLNVYRNVYGSGGSYSLTQKQIIVMRTFATLVEKTQQIYAASLQYWVCRSTGQGIFWFPVLIMLFMIILELSFQVSALYRPLRKALERGRRNKLDQVLTS